MAILLSFSLHYIGSPVGSCQVVYEFCDSASTLRSLTLCLTGVTHAILPSTLATVTGVELRPVCMIYLAVRPITEGCGNMATKDASQKLGKLVETAISVANIAQAKAEEILKDLSHVSEVQRNQMKGFIEDAASRSKQSRDLLLKAIRQELEKQIKLANSTTKEELAKLSDKLNAFSHELAGLTDLREELSKIADTLSTLGSEVRRAAGAKADPDKDSDATAARRPNRTGSTATRPRRPTSSTGPAAATATKRSRSNSASGKDEKPGSKP